MGLCTLSVQCCDGVWEVHSEDGETTYHVTKTSNSCRKEMCNLICKLCKICVHIYTSDCSDFLIMGTICKHIHLVHRHVMSSKEINISENPTITNTEKPSEVQFLKSCVHQPTTDVEAIQRRTKSKLLTLMNGSERTTNIEALK